MFGISNVSGNCILGCSLALAMFVPLDNAHAAFKVLYAFEGGTDGSYPEASLIRDRAGNLYGTTEYGGTYDAGTIFRLAPHGAESVLHSFGGAGDGENPTANVVADKAANLYGTTQNGGAGNAGTVFKLAPDGTETVLYSFRGGSDGANPPAGLIRSAGILYGTTQAGGSGGEGVVFRLAPNGTETVLHAFTGGADGGQPLAGLLSDGSGSLYGTTYLGGANGQGTVYEIAPNGTETVLYSFAGGSDGAKPAASLILDENGNLYGTTVLGGVHDAGTVFKLAPDGTERVLYSFTGGNEGANPSCSLVLDAAGNLYGTTPVSGIDGSGAVFKLAPDGTVTVLHAFSGSGGADPGAGLIVDDKGHLYGTTPESGRYGYGIVFKLRK
jgi:uncharacterized repeat protein (TIGR03803 family)